MERNLSEMTLEELEERYRQLAQDIQQIDFTKMEEQDRQKLKEYQEIKNFYTDTANSLAFVSQSAGMVMNDGSTEIKSMMKPEEYGQLLNTLSNSRDKEFEQLLQAEKVSEQTFSERQADYTLIQKVPETAVRSPEIREAAEQTAKKEYTVGEVIEAVERSQQLMQEYGIDKEDALFQTETVFHKLNQEGKLISLTKEEPTPEQQEEKYEAEKPASIVESSDGYVMNTSKVLTADDMKHLAAEYHVEHGNEVHHAVAMETTNDKSKVSPVIHLEEDNISTLESEMGITEEMKKNNDNLER